MPVPERPVLVAPDSFKGTFNAAQVAGAIGRGLEKAGLMPPDLCPVADGGEGTLDALLPQLGGELIAVTVKGPLGKPVRTGFGLVEDGGTAIVEMAMASGLGLVAEDERDAWAATTYGTGELIAAAAQAGAQVILVAVGGSATSDGGAGALASDRGSGWDRQGEDRRADRRPHDVRGRPEGLRPAEGRRRADDPAARAAPGRAGSTASEGPARRPDDRRGRRPVRRPVGRSRRGARAGRPVRARRARLRRADEGLAGRGDRRGQARRPDAAGQARGRDRHANQTGGRAPARDRRHRRDGRVREADHRPPDGPGGHEHRRDGSGRRAPRRGARQRHRPSRRPSPRGGRRGRPRPGTRRRARSRARTSARR